MAATEPTHPAPAATKQRKPRKAPEGHKVTFFIKDEATWSALTAEAAADEREPDNLAALIVRKHFKAKMV